MPAKCNEWKVGQPWRGLPWNIVALGAVLVFTSAASADGTLSLNDRLSLCVETEFYEIDSCYHTLAELAEQEMVDAYLVAKVAVEDFDKRETQAPTAVERLQNAQTLFEEYRKIHCEWPDVFTNFVGHNWSVREWLVCRTELTLFRVEQLGDISSYDPDNEVNK